ncbi:hypothetical protein ACP3V3_02950 [Vibrio sp. PNB22_3_1]
MYDLVSDFKRLRLDSTLSDCVFRLMVLSLAETIIGRVTSNRFEHFKLTQSLSRTLLTFMPDLTVHQLLHFCRVVSVVVLNRTPGIDCVEFNHALERVLSGYKEYPSREEATYIYVPPSVLIDHTLPVVLNVDLDELFKMRISHFLVSVKE